MAQTKAADRQISLFNNLLSGEIILGQGSGTAPLPASIVNLGGGSAVFKQTTSNQIQFRSLVVSSSALSITENTNDLSIDLIEANLSGIPISSITGLGTIATQNASSANLIFTSGGFNLFDSSDDDYLSIILNEDLSANKILNLLVNDGNRTLNLSGDLTVSSSATISGTNTGDQNLFSTIAVSGQSNVVADSTSDTLTLIAGTNITITTNATNDEITINSSGGAGVSDGDKGDITVSSSGTVWTIDDDTVSFAKLANMNTGRLVGRTTAGVGDPEEIRFQGGIEDDGSGNLQVAAFTGDVTKTAGGTSLTIASGAVLYSKIQNISATDKLLGRSTAGAGVVEEITCTAAGRALIDDIDASAQRTTLGLKTGALVNISVGTSAPGSPSTGDIWIDTN